jgi:beta-aspartyl-peptidase (threonine type)
VNVARQSIFSGMRLNYYFCWLLLAVGTGLAMESSAQTTLASSPEKNFGLVIHGGAGAPPKIEVTPEADRLYHAKIQEALNAGYAVLQTNGAATDAVIAAVKVMEDAGMFDAGKGSVFNSDGICELDAAIMDGRTLSAGGVTGLQHIKNPITLARAVMDKSPHVLMMGEGAEKFARQHGFEMVPNSYFQTERRRKQWEQLQKQKHDSGQAVNFETNPEALGTVGCVALDKNGNLAAGTSTGGTADKLAGRIGDTPIIGAGTYADNATCAVSGTGIGEYYIRTVFCHNVSALMAYKGWSLAQASTEAMRQMEAIGGRGGCIAIDRAGNVVMPFNTPAMYRGFKLSNGRSDIELYGEKP